MSPCLLYHRWTLIYLVLPKHQLELGIDHHHHITIIIIIHVLVHFSTNCRTPQSFDGSWSIYLVQPFSSFVIYLSSISAITEFLCQCSAMYCTSRQSQYLQSLYFLVLRCTGCLSQQLLSSYFICNWSFITPTMPTYFFLFLIDRSSILTTAEKHFVSSIMAT